MKDSSWLFTRKIWTTCTFHGLGTKKQAYLDIFAEMMAKKNFKVVQKEPSGVVGHLLKGRDLLLESPDKTGISIRAISAEGDFRVGYTVELNVTWKKAWFWLIGSILLGLFLMFISAYIIGHGVFPLTNLPRWIRFIPIIIFFLVPFGTLFYLRIPEITLSRQVKQQLIEIAESMGSKQITSFKKTTVELEG